MNIPTKTLANGFTMPVYGMGLARVGGNAEADYSQDEIWVNAIQDAIANGVTHFDTAEAYGAGHSEELLGQAIKGVDRSSLLLTSKVLASNQTYDGVHKACEASLKRLNVDYLDLYLLHSFPEPGIDITETVRAMTQLVDEGLIKHIGVSNFTNKRYAAAQAATPHKIICNQLHYNVKFREVEENGILKYLQDNDSLLVAWKPIQRGELEQVNILDELAEKYSKTWRQIAINWLISQNNVTAICKTTSIEHLRENLGALDWQMEAEDIERIRNDYPDQDFVSNWPLDHPGDVTAY
jgi:diketogulonate reductase-like aldo/keto reductase